MEEAKVKIICSVDPERVNKQAEEFERTHNIVDIKQTEGTLMIVFYTENQAIMKFKEDVAEEITMDLGTDMGRHRNRKLEGRR